MYATGEVAEMAKSARVVEKMVFILVEWFERVSGSDSGSGRRGLYSIWGDVQGVAFGLGCCIRFNSVSWLLC